jgi:uncharacterized membrane protein YgcG
MSNELDPLGGYRVGDAERARTVDLIKEAHVAGYLDLSEIDERLSAALAARTRADLERLVADLPPEWRARQAGQGQPATPASRRQRPREIAPQLAHAVPVLVTIAIAALVVLSISRGFFFPWPLLWVFLIFGRHHRGGRGGGGWDGGRRDRRTTWV